MQNVPSASLAREYAPQFAAADTLVEPCGRRCRRPTSKADLCGLNTVSLFEPHASSVRSLMHPKLSPCGLLRRDVHESGWATNSEPTQDCDESRPTGARLLI